MNDIALILRFPLRVSIRTVRLAFLVVSPLTYMGVSIAAPTFYVENPTRNSIDWTNAVTSLGGTINSNINFDAHPLGNLESDFYLPSDGVVITTNMSGGIVFGAGPAQANYDFQPGEGVHAISNYLRNADESVEATTTTISFSSPVVGAGLFTIDYWAYFTEPRISLHAYSGVNGTGSLLGSAFAIRGDVNFQQNKLYFMGVADPGNRIMSIVFIHEGTNTDLIGIDNIRFATRVPEPASLLIAVFAARMLFRRASSSDPSDRG